jgi:hypothetical protein
MSIAGLFSSGFSSSQLGTQSNQLQKSEFQQLGQDLSSGNMSAAQSDFATLQQAFAQSAPVSSSTSTSNPVAQAFQQLSTDLQSGNLSAAQKDYSTIQNDLGKMQPRHVHHHPPLKSSGSGSGTDLLMQELSQAAQTGSTNTGSASNVSSQSAAQQAYATLQQDFASALGAESTAATQGLSLTPVSDLSVSMMA